MNNMACFQETFLTKDESFYDDLKDRRISEQHQHADEIGCTTMLNYHNHYHRSDILVTCDL